MRVNSQQSALSQAEQNITDGRRRIAVTCAADGDGGDGCVCVHVCARACVRRVRLRVYARVRVCARACVHA